MLPADQILGENSIDTLRMQITERGATWHHREKKETLVNRILELNVAAQANDKLNQGTQPQAVKTFPKQERLTKEEARKACQKWLDRGLTMRFSPDGNLWLMEFDTGRTIRRDSGNMTIPPAVMARCGEMLVRPRADENRGTPPTEQALAQYVDG